MRTLKGCAWGRPSTVSRAWYDPGGTDSPSASRTSHTIRLNPALFVTVGDGSPRRRPLPPLAARALLRYEFTMLPAGSMMSSVTVPEAPFGR